MIFRNQVDRDTTHVAREVVENMTATNLGRVVVALIVMLTSNGGTTTTASVVVILVGIVTGVKEMIDAGQVEEVIVTVGEEVVGSSQKVKATAAEITAIMMTITLLDECRESRESI